MSSVHPSTSLRYAQGEREKVAVRPEPFNRVQDRLGAYTCMFMISWYADTSRLRTCTVC